MTNSMPSPLPFKLALDRVFRQKDLYQIRDEHYLLAEAAKLCQDNGQSVSASSFSGYLHESNPVMPKADTIRKMALGLQAPSLFLCIAPDQLLESDFVVVNEMRRRGISLPTNVEELAKAVARDT